MRDKIVDAAKSIYLEEGLKALSIRKIAKKIHYSPSIIYEYYQNKNAIFCSLSSIVSQELYDVLKKVDQTLAPQEYLKALLKANSEYLSHHQEAWEILSYLRFGEKSKEVPDDLTKVEELFMHALKDCKCAQLESKEDFEAAFDILRSQITGTMLLLKNQTSQETKGRILKSLERALIVLLKGWGASLE